MKVLVIGSGGREHTIAWKISKSPVVTQVICAPGNPGCREVALCEDSVKVDDVEQLLLVAKKHNVDLTIVGPEVSLAAGVVDRFKAEGLKIFGPTKAAAQLEASKSFAKEIMQSAGVPTAGYAVCSSEGEIRELASRWGLPIVLKADGLAAGKGVFVCHTEDEFNYGCRALFTELLADKVVVEQFLHGVEASFIVATDGINVVPLSPAHDYKRIGDNDTGLNTGGMGTVSPTPRLSEEQGSWTVENVIRPTLREMEKRGVPFSGFLYAGLMIAPDGAINVVEFNARLGDPETQVILRRLDSDLAILLDWLASSPDAKEREKPEVKWSQSSAVCVVLAADGYPGQIRKGDVIDGVNLTHSIPGVQVFHAGTALNDRGELVTSGGRVLNVTATGADLNEARRLVYRAVDIIQFRGRQARRDIGVK